MKVILIGNYPLDKQESMERFAVMLEDGFRAHGNKCTIWRPVVVCNLLFKSSIRGFGKWLGYLDKWTIFPLILVVKAIKYRLSAEHIHFHICDHSNSPYLKCFPASKTSITCHDVLAIRGALGHEDAYCPASPFGKIMQKWICSNLSKARKVICDSEMTLHQLIQLTGKSNDDERDYRIVHVAFNNDFRPMDKTQAINHLLNKGHDFTRPFCLHVGSGLPRKNRILLIEMTKLLGEKWAGKICFAGEAIDDQLLARSADLGLSERIVSVVKPDHKTLLALYSSCEVFIFPSYSEGFGWPLIEAQACGAPVIASSIAPMPEISGNMAIHCSPKKPEDFADAYLWLSQDENRQKLIERGFENVKRFDMTTMIKKYLDIMVTP